MPVCSDLTFSTVILISGDGRAGGFFAAPPNRRAEFRQEERRLFAGDDG